MNLPPGFELRSLSAPARLVAIPADPNGPPPMARPSRITLDCAVCQGDLDPAEGVLHAYDPPGAVVIALVVVQERSGRQRHLLAPRPSSLLRASECKVVHNAGRCR